MCRLCKLWRGRFASTDGPHRFVSNDDVCPVADEATHGSQLPCVDVVRPVRFSLFKSLTNTQNCRETVVKGVFGLLRYFLIALFVECPPLRVTDQGVLDSEIEHLLNT